MTGDPDVTQATFETTGVRCPGDSGFLLSTTTCRGHAFKQTALTLRFSDLCQVRSGKAKVAQAYGGLLVVDCTNNSQLHTAIIVGVAQKLILNLIELLADGMTAVNQLSLPVDQLLRVDDPVFGGRVLQLS